MPDSAETPWEARCRMRRNATRRWTLDSVLTKKPFELPDYIHRLKMGWWTLTGSKVDWAAVQPGRPGLSTTLSVKGLPLPISFRSTSCCRIPVVSRGNLPW